MRLMDGADQVFSFPFELLLGAEAPVGVKNEPILVSGKYRWNCFRDTHQVQQAAREQKALGHNALDPAESELNDWLKEQKFDALSKYRDSAKAFVDSLAGQSQDQRSLLYIDAVLAYIKSMKAIFARHNAAINLIHSPCVALDWESPCFWRIFSKVIVIAIDPKWGFGNMYSRNQIPPSRYLERWLRINQVSLQLKQKHPGQVLILRSSVNPLQQSDNVVQSHEFLGIENIKAVTNKPTLLGEDMGDLGFPFGGILSWSLNCYQNSIDVANAVLDGANNSTLDLLNQCKSLYNLLDS
jgi:hypothetical protein